MMKSKTFNFGILISILLFSSNLKANDGHHLSYKGQAYISFDDENGPVKIEKTPVAIEKSIKVEKEKIEVKSNIPVAKKTKIPKKTNNLTYKPQQLSFKSIEVNGKIEKPRIVFEREILKIEQIDELPLEDSFQKIFESQL